MKILINKGTYKIEQFSGDIKSIEKYARVCYQSNNERKGLSGEKFIEWLLKHGHESVIEHSLITVIFNNVSRGFTHEMVRHRLASFSQESTRYTDPRKESGQLKVVLPEDKDLDSEFLLVREVLYAGDKNTVTRPFGVSVREWLELNEQMYEALLEKGWQKQDARQILPIGTKSQIVVSANFREWRHIFKLRTNEKAHWEIRGVMRALLDDVKKRVPVIFDDILDKR